MIQKESRLEVADNSGAKIVQVIGVLVGSTARGRYTRRAVGVGDRIVCSVKKSLPNSEIKTKNWILLRVVKEAVASA